MASSARSCDPAMLTTYCLLRCLAPSTLYWLFHVSLVSQTARHACPEMGIIIAINAYRAFLVTLLPRLIRPRGDIYIGPLNAYC